MPELAKGNCLKRSLLANEPLLFVLLFQLSKTERQGGADSSDT